MLSRIPALLEGKIRFDRIAKMAWPFIEQWPGAIFVLNREQVLTDTFMLGSIHAPDEVIEEDIFRVHRGIRLKWIVPVSLWPLLTKEVRLRAGDCVTNTGKKLFADWALPVRNLLVSFHSPSPLS